MRFKRALGLLSVRRAGLLVITAAPGLQRLAFMAILSARLPVESVGLVMADLGIAAFLSLLAGGALSTQVMASWAGMSDAASRRRVSNQMLVWQAAALAIVAPLTALLWKAGLVAAPVPVFLFFLGFSIWQTERAKLLCDRRLVPLLVVEVCLTAMAAASALVSATTALAAYGAAMLMAGVAVMVFGRQLTGMQEKTEAAKGLNHRETAMLAANSMVSTGRDLLMVPAIRWVAGNATAGLAAQVLTTMSALLLLPRALSYHYMPGLSRQAGSASGIAGVLADYQRSMSLVLAGISVALLVGVGVAWSAGVHASQLLVIGLAGASLVAGQASLVSASVLMVRQSVAPILTSALWTTLVWALAVLALAGGRSNGQWLAEALLLLAVVLSLGRALYLRRRADRAVDPHHDALTQGRS
ncbi:MAG TPA: hypothetical protein VIT90_18020 [Lysobacter sp.]